MTERDLRRRERAWRAERTLEREVGYLAARVRAGVTARERVFLAAYCGHEGSRSYLGDEAPRVPASA